NRQCRSHPNHSRASSEARAGFVRLVHAAGPLSSRAWLLLVRPVRDRPQRRLFHERHRRAAVWAVVSRAVLRNLGAARQDEQFRYSRTGSARRAVRAGCSRVRAETSAEILRCVALSDTRAISNSGRAATPKAGGVWRQG